MSAYYNENNPFAAAWLRELIKADLIAPGKVDERSISDVQPADLVGYDQCHFFAGIGGWSYALRRAGWPDARPVWTGSCPCQPFSSAGAGLGVKDHRHLWPEWFRLIRACRPLVVFGEQVAAFGVIGKTLQNVRPGKARGLIQAAQQGWLAWDLPRLREQTDEGDEALAVRSQACLSGSTASDPSWVCSDERRAETSEEEGDSLRSGLAKHSDPRGVGTLRGDGIAVRSHDAEGVERAFAGSGEARGGLHQGEHQGCPVCAQYNGEQLGDQVDRDHCRCASKETVIGQVERLITATGRRPEKTVRGPWLDVVRDDLERAHYAVGASVLAACSLSAPHLRQRLYFVADAAHNRHERSGSTRGRRDGSANNGKLGNASRARLPERQRPQDGHGAVRDQRETAPETGPAFWSDCDWIPCRDWKWRPTQRGVAPLVAGLPRGMGRRRDPGAPINVNTTAEARVGRLRGYGNALCAPVAESFIKAYMETPC